MGDVDPEDTKSLDSSDGAAVGAEENHSSNSDMVHLEQEEAELLEEEERARKEEEEEEEEEEDLQTSVLSVLGGERELDELREEEEQDLHAPQTEELLVCAEEPHVEKEPAEFRQVVPPMALPPLPLFRLDPPSTTSTPVPSTTTSEVEELFSVQGLQPPSILAPVEPLEPVEPPPAEAAEAAAPQQTAAAPSSTELLLGGAALVAVLGVVAYGAVAFCRK
ncbi:uncharacterized protein V6R79_012836 [Siganus canaliculatus]